MPELDVYKRQEYPYGVYIASKRHLGALPELNEQEKNNRASVLKRTVGMLDSLFGYICPYMMCMHQTPVNGEAVSYTHLDGACTEIECNG